MRHTKFTQHGMQPFHALISNPTSNLLFTFSFVQMIIVSEADLHLLNVPCVVQQYYNHDEALYKVYVIDTDVTVFRRQSLPNLHLSAARQAIPATTDASTAAQDGGAPIPVDPVGPVGVRSLAFDSRKNYPTHRDFITSQGRSTATETDTPPENMRGSANEEVSSSSAWLEMPLEPALIGEMMTI